MIIGMAITKQQQVDAVAHAAGITAQQARLALDAVAGVVVAGLVEDGRISVQGLGSFVVRRQRERRVMNPSTSVIMELPSRAVVKFRPAKDLRVRVEARHT